MCGAIIRPNVLIKKMLRYQVELTERGITFEMKRTHDRKKQAGLKERRNQLTEMITRAESVYENIDKFLPIIQKYTDITELNTHILNDLIQKIVVCEKTDNPHGSKSQRMDIHYKFIGYVEMKEMFGLQMIIPVAKNVEVDDTLIAEVKEMSKELVR